MNINLSFVLPIAVLALGCGTSTSGGAGGEGGSGGTGALPENVEQTCRDWCANEPGGSSCYPGPADSIPTCYLTCLSDYQAEDSTGEGKEWLAVKQCQLLFDCEDRDCRAAVEVTDLRDFDTFGFSQGEALGFCPWLTQPGSAVVEKVGADQYEMRFSMIKPVYSEGDGCLPPFISTEYGCFEEKNWPSRRLQVEEVTTLKEAFEVVVVLRHFDGSCDPCVVERFDWDGYGLLGSVCGFGEAMVIHPKSLDRIWPQLDDLTWRYATRNATWGDPTRIDSSDEDAALDPKIAVDSNGNALAVWSQSDDARHSIWSNRYVPTTGWAAAEQVQTEDQESAVKPEIAVSSSGEAMAVWEQSDGAQTRIWANRYVPTAGWATAEPIEAHDGGSAHDPRIAVDSAGHAIAVWVREGELRSNRFTPAVGWSVAESIGADAAHPDVALDPAGNAAAVWTEADVDRSQFGVWASRFTTMTGWSAPERIVVEDAAVPLFPKVGMDTDGNAIAVWSHAEVWANRFTPAEGWGDAERVHYRGRSAAIDLAVHPDGSAIAVWHGYWGIWAGRFTPAQGWWTVQIDGYFFGSFEDDVRPSVAIDPDGRAVAVWRYEDDLWFNQLIPSVGWSAADCLDCAEDEPASISQSPQVAFDSEGRATLVWEQVDGLGTTIWANRFEYD